MLRRINTQGLLGLSGLVISSVHFFDGDDRLSRFMTGLTKANLVILCCFCREKRVLAILILIFHARSPLGTLGTMKRHSGISFPKKVRIKTAR